FEQTDEWKRAKSSHTDWTNEKMWTEDPVCKGYLASLEPFNQDAFKVKYEAQHQDEFQTVTPLSDTEKQKLWDNTAGDPYKALDDYKKNGGGKEYEDIASKKNSYKNGDGKDYFSGLTESQERGVWKNADLETKGGKDIPYIWLYKEFKKDYESKNAEVFKKKEYSDSLKSDDEQEKIWKDSSTVPYRDL
ncbi:MAG: hypothetical protein KBS81_02385, partial [Spirochaetales bacterium]|nr:hypothetical protein [Candidatus Physcosoma equi]